MTDSRLRYDPDTQFDTDRKDFDMITNALIEARDLRKTYQLGKRAVVPALRGVDISIGQGEMVAIMGPSGSGKSTLMHILGLLHAPEQKDGPRPELWFEGRDMTRLGESERTRIRAERMGFVFQSFNLVPTLTAQENVLLACNYAGVKGAKAEAAARARPAPGGPGRPCRPPSVRAVGRRAAAHRHGTRAGQPTLARPRRRAHRQPRQHACA